MSGSLSQFPAPPEPDLVEPAPASPPTLRLASSQETPAPPASVREDEQTGRHTVAPHPVDLPRLYTLTLLPRATGSARSFLIRPERALAFAATLLAGSFALALTVGWLARAEPARASGLASGAPLGASLRGDLGRLSSAVNAYALPASLPREDATAREASLRAGRLGLGTVATAQRLLMGLPEASWVAAAGDESPTTLLWPVAEGGYVRGYGSGEGGYHLAVDVSGDRGTRVRASAAGVVGYAGDGIRGYGNIVMLVHPGGWVTMYAHNQRNRVVSGQLVERGELIAELGSTGISRGPHVHYEFMHRGRNCDPAPLFRPGVMHRNGNLWVKDTEWDAPYDHDGTVRCAPRRRHPNSRYGAHAHAEEIAEPELSEDADNGAASEPTTESSTEAHALITPAQESEETSPPRAEASSASEPAEG